MQTWYATKDISIANLKPEHLHIKDVAKSLANTNRYRGLLGMQLNVAAHSVYMANYFMELGDYKNAYVALLHDAPEMILNDILPEVKDLVPGIRKFETKYLWPIFQEAFSIPNITKKVHDLDKNMIELEKSYKVPRLTPDQAFVEFLELYYLLRRKLEISTTI